MPELPEVETIKRELEKVILSKKIKDVIIKKPKVIKEPSLQEFKKKLVNNAIKKILRRAKILIMELEKEFLIIHLKISGWLLYGEENQKSALSILFEDGKYLNYMDQRLLGELRIRKNFEDLKFIKELGPEPFELNLEEFSKILKKKKTRIKLLLMDQKIISGIGNIYAAEALFRAEIHPERIANTLSDFQIKELFTAIHEVLKEAIKYKGSSVDTYRDIYGQEGKMEQRLKVYGRHKKPCLVCKTLIEKIELGGRSTYFCPKCQK